MWGRSLGFLGALVKDFGLIVDRKKESRKSAWLLRVAEPTLECDVVVFLKREEYFRVASSSSSKSTRARLQKKRNLPFCFESP